MQHICIEHGRAVYSYSYKKSTKIPDANLLYMPNYYSIYLKN